MRFHLKANATFDADDLEDAFLRAAEHLLRLAWPGESDEDIGLQGEVSVTPVRDDTSTA